MIELKGLRGKNTSVIKHMRSRIEAEQRDFDVSGAKIHAVRSVHLKLLREVFALLGTASLKAEMAELTKELRQPGIKLGVRKAYTLTFDRLRQACARRRSPAARSSRCSPARSGSSMPNTASRCSRRRNPTWPATSATSN
jgi:hypothetical protein